MTDKVYVGALVSSEVLEHSSGPWKKHGYVKKTQENGYTRYWYAEDIKKNNRKAGGKNPSEEDIKNAEEAYKQAAEEYSAAKKAYDANPTEENKAKLSVAGMKLEAAGTGQGYADAYRRRTGEKSDKGVKETLKEKANEKLNGLFNRPSTNTAQMLSTRANYPVGAKNPTTSQLKKGASVVGKFVKSRVDHLRSEHERAEKLDQWYKDGKPVINDENADMYLTRSSARMNARKPISRKKNVITGSARIDAKKRRK